MTTHPENENTSRSEDDTVERSLRALTDETLPVDEAMLDSIRTEVQRELAAPRASDVSVNDARGNGGDLRAASDDESIGTTSEQDSVSPRVSRGSVQPERRRTMFAPLTSLSAAVAALVGMAFWMSSADIESGDNTVLASALDKLESAETLRIYVRKGRETETLIVQQPGAVRREFSDVRYQIAEPGQLWEFDGRTGRDLPSDSFNWFSETGKVNPLAVMGLNQVDRAELVGLQADGLTMFDGKSVLRYRFVRHPDTTEFLVDPENETLRGIRIRRQVGRQFTPVKEVRLLAMNEPVDASLFAASDSLQNDNRVGKVTRAQGLVTLRPQSFTRWTTVSEGMIVKPGDWVRTSSSGAHAALIQMIGPTALTLGPGTQIEIRSENEVRLLSGEVKVALSEKPRNLFTLSGPSGEPVRFREPGHRVLRLSNAAPVRRTLEELDNEPAWLAGFEGSGTDSPLGSLIVEVDGRNVPLTIGEHHVRVEVRDQIARTVIEETFRNETDTRLEGVFHFPLPQEASISGFGMWINGELVEADVVEKQRAREIYETILREKRDPGLLEWTGGNIFKARVFPIEPHSEKRVKITYTQVLPMEGNSYRYRYALASEMLKTTPLRDLSLNVLISSALPLKSVASPTHIVRTQQTTNVAEVSFSAQQYTPVSDFELVCELDRGVKDVVAVPHRRGDDGYFLLQFMPPGRETNWQRMLLPEGEPIDVTLLCDTSASMSKGQRDQQLEFVRAVLASLGRNDRFNLATCDVETDWIQRRYLAVDPARSEAVLKSLSERVSLGWSDLDRAFETIAKSIRDTKGKRERHVIYIGDGRVTTVTADPQAFVSRLERLLDAENVPSAGTVGFHSVSVGSTTESVVLKGIATLGGGSFRELNADESVAAVASSLLSEIATPGLRDIKLEFSGIRTAAVYPKRLPNLAAGKQQIVTGRFLPQETTPEAKVIVTGTYLGKPVRMEAPFEIDADESGNSFIPRLWARGHLDHLLEQGTSPEVRNDVIALSERFHIMTPYTSLLVLESDADRERFGVKKRYQMRDGERFFADARDDAKETLRQQQMRRAGDWRIGMQQASRSRLSGGTRLPPVSVPVSWSGTRRHTTWDFVNGNGVVDSYARFDVFHTNLGDLGRRDIRLQGIEGYAGSSWYDSGLSVGGTIVTDKGMMWGQPAGLRGEYTASASPNPAPMYNGFGINDSFSVEYGFSRPESLRLQVESLSDMISEVQFDSLNQFGMPEQKLAKQVAGGRYGRSSRGGYHYYLDTDRDGISLQNGRGIDRSYNATSGFVLYPRLYEDQKLTGYHRSIAPPSSDSLLVPFPIVPGVPAKPVPGKTAKWSDDVLRIVEPIGWRKRLRSVEGGLSVRTLGITFDPRWNRETGRNAQVELSSQQKWLRRPDGAGIDRVIQYCDDEHRGVWSATFGLGSQRKAEERDRTLFVPDLKGRGQSALETVFPGYAAKIASQTETNAVLVLTSESNAKQVYRIEIDREKNVVLSFEDVYEGRRQSIEHTRKFANVADVWIPTVIETLNADGQLVGRQTQSVDALTAEEFDKRYAKELQQPEELVSRDEAILLTLPLVSLEKARKQVQTGEAEWQDHLMLLQEQIQRQKWDEAAELFKTFEAAIGPKPGQIWMRIRLLQLSGMPATLRTVLQAEARKIAATTRIDDLVIAKRLREFAYPILGWNEYSDLLGSMKEVWFRQPEHMDGEHLWDTNWEPVLRNLGKAEAAFELVRKMAEDRPAEMNRWIQISQRYADRGEFGTAYEWLDRLEQRTPALWNWEWESVFVQRVRLLEMQDRYEDIRTQLDRWMEKVPASRKAHTRLLLWMVMENRIEDASRLALSWLEQARVEGKLSDLQSSRWNAGYGFVIGSGEQQAWWRYDDSWLPVLLESGLHHLGEPEQFDFALRVLSNLQSADAELAATMQKRMREIVLSESETRSVNQIRKLVPYVTSGRHRLNEDQTRELIKIFMTRWEKAEAPSERNAWSQLIVDQHRRIDSAEDYRKILRWRLETAEEMMRIQYRNELFNHILNSAADTKAAEEVLSLLPMLAEPTTALPKKTIKNHLDQQRAAVSRTEQVLQRLQPVIDQLLRQRIRPAIQEFESDPKLEELTPAERKLKKEEITRREQRAFIKILSTFADRWQKRSDAAAVRSVEKLLLGELAAWTRMEIDSLRLKDDAEAKVVVQRLIEMIGDAPPEAKSGEDDTEDQHLVDLTLRIMNARRQGRALAIIFARTIRDDADKALVNRMVKWLQTGASREGTAGLVWKGLLVDLLLAIDRPADLETHLKKWIAASEFPNRWRRTLAMLQAERGDVPTAVKTLEAVRATEEVTPFELRQLADWYLVLGQNDESRDAKLKTVLEANEGELSEVLQQRWNQRNNSGLPVGEPVKDETIAVWNTLLQKTSAPGNYFGTLSSWYRRTKDFRLLQALAESVLDQTAESTYSAVRSAKAVVDQVNEEASADEMLKFIAKLRKRPDQSTLNRRALDLLTVLIESQAAAMEDEPGPHVDRAVTALRAAFRDEWMPGERGHFQQFLHSIGGSPADRLEVVRQELMKSLADNADIGTVEGVQIVRRYADAIAIDDKRLDESIRLLETAIDGYLVANPTGWPQELNSVLGRWRTLMQSVGRFAEVESRYLAMLENPVNPSQRNHFEAVLDQSYVAALKAGGRVTLGEGDKLYVALRDRYLSKIRLSNENERVERINQLMALFRVGEELNIDRAGADLEEFAFKTLPKIIERQRQNYGECIDAVVDELREIVSPRVALRFLIVRVENWPTRLWVEHDAGWGRFGQRLGWHRANLKAPLFDLEPRLLKIVLDKQKRYLTGKQSDSPYLFHDNYSYFWAEKRADFVRATMTLLKEKQIPTARLSQTSEYLWSGLEARDEAIELLLSEYKAGRNSRSDTLRLVSYLFTQDREREAIPVLMKMVKDSPSDLAPRTLLMNAYAATDQQDELNALLAAIEKRWRDNDWSITDLRTVASAAVDCKMEGDAVRLYRELITRDREVHGEPISPDPTRAHDYRSLAEAEAQVGETMAAIEALGFAWILSRQHDQKKEILDEMDDVLKRSPNIDVFVKALERRAEESGRYNPLVRKRLGLFFLNHSKEPAAAVTHLEIALEYSAPDSELYTALRTAHERLNHTPRVIELLLEEIEQHPRRYTLYSELAKAYGDKDAANSERALTAIVESAPNESESHQHLARELGKRSRHTEAIPLWKQVASLREREPGGLLGLVESQIKAKQYAGAEASLKTLRETDWPDRFDEQLEKTLPQLEGQLKSAMTQE